MRIRPFHFSALLLFLAFSACGKNGDEPAAPPEGSFALTDGSSVFKSYAVGEQLFVSVPPGTDVTGLTPVADYGKSEVHYDSQDFSDFTKPVKMTVRNGSYALMYKILVMDLPLVEINTPSGAAVESKEWVEGCQVLLHETDGSVSDLGPASVRGRGNTTWTFPKKPFALKFEQKTSFFGLPKEKRWNLLANWLDHTLLRTDTGLEIARRCPDLDWTPGGDFVELVMDGKFLGNYYLVDQIKVSSKRVDIHEMDTEKDVEGDALTGGYLLDYDEYYDEDYKFRSALLDFPVCLKSPDENVKQVQLDYISGYVAELEAALTDPTRLAARDYAAYLDIDSFIDWYFVFELVNGGGAIAPKDVYMHKDRGGVIKAGPVWDFDWGTFRTDRKGLYHSNSVYYPYLLKDPVFVARLKEKWAEEKPEFGKVLAHIDETAPLIARSAERNRLMWPIDGSYASRKVNADETLTFDQACARLRKAYADRIEAFDILVKNL